LKLSPTACLIVALTAMMPSRSEAADALTPAIVQQINATVQQAQNATPPAPVTIAQVDALFRAATLQYGNVKPLLDWLATARMKNAGSRAQILAEIEVHIASKRGDLQRASKVLAGLIEPETETAGRADLRLWQAKLFDALGRVEEARQSYQSLAADDLPAAEQQRVGLRLALMGLVAGSDASGRAGDKQQTDAKKLIELANNSTDVAFRNRAAIVLAVQNEFVAAVKLFTIVGEGAARFRSASRLTEWAIRAGDRDKAIEAAWVATRSAQIKRDRLYALALLVESYRLQQQRKGLEALLAAFVKEDQGEQPISREMRMVWVELLRELGRHKDAIALFKSTAGDSSGFPVEMRRELLEMEGAAGNIERMIQLYRGLIATEPHEPTWRGGLTRVLLEQGRDAEARQLWASHLKKQTTGASLLLSAKTLGDLGLDALAAKAVEQMVKLRADAGQGLLFLADLQRERGQLAAAHATLDRLHHMPEMSDAVLSELAGAY